MKIRLTYFDFAFWRAEASRLALTLGGVPFEDVRLSRNEFREMKAAGAFPVGQVPVLEVDGVMIAQSLAIARFCGRVAGFYPMDDALAAARVDELLNTAEQITGLISPTMREGDPERRAAMRATLSEDTLPFWLDALERRLTVHGADPWCVGERMTIADLVLWRLLGWLTSGMLDGISTELLLPHSRLKALCIAVSRVPGVSC